MWKVKKKTLNQFCCNEKIEWQKAFFFFLSQQHNLQQKGLKWLLNTVIISLLTFSECYSDFTLMPRLTGVIRMQLNSLLGNFLLFSCLFLWKQSSNMNMKTFLVSCRFISFFLTSLNSVLYDMLVFFSSILILFLFYSLVEQCIFLSFLCFIIGLWRVTIVSISK